MDYGRLVGPSGARFLASTTAAAEAAAEGEAAAACNPEQSDQQQISQQHDTAAVGAVKLVDEGGEVYMKCDAPAYEDVDVEEDGEETELMPPKEIEEEEVGREVKEELAGLKNQWAPEVVSELERVCMKRWRVLSNKIGGVSDFEFKLKVEGGGTEGVLPTVPSATR